MKKLMKTTMALVLVTGAFFYGSQEKVNAADPIDQPYGGLCCEAPSSACWHPNGDIYIEAKWVADRQFCK